MLYRARVLCFILHKLQGKNTMGLPEVHSLYLCHCIRTLILILLLTTHKTSLTKSMDALHSMQ